MFKLLKGLLLVGAGVGAFKLSNSSPFTVALELARRANVDAHPRLVEWMLTKLFQLQPRKLEALGIGSLAYGSLFLVEGIGLWLEKRWAEYLTIISTAGFIPFEIYELTRKLNVERVAILAVNLAIVAYLIWRVRSERRGSAPEGRRKPGASGTARPLSARHGYGRPLSGAP